ncbi:Guanyl-specific ribonuclease Sa, partial [Gilliamella apicola SCGC AB-598-I20]
AISSSKNAVENNFFAPAIPLAIVIGESVGTCFATGPCIAIVAGVATAVGYEIIQENSDNNSSNNELNNSEATAVGGAPILPPDDDNDKNKQNDKIKEEKLNDLPDNVQNTYSKYEKNGWNGNFNGQTPGTNAGRTFKNSDNQLPTVDSNGSPITYREFDVNNKIAGQARDAERFIRGSDGSVYYTNNHYQTFIKLIK